ncbi:MAG: YsnF/AvaK domain-containing protein [Actinomycetota bacterium]|nr:YsnF/AvaK domain-containing protein [Actinomycetota bacterium]
MTIEVVRSEEELRTSVRRVARERVVVRTRVVTEDVTLSFQVRKQVVEIEREPFDAAIAAAEGLALERGPESLEVVVYEERPVVTMELVPVERIRVTREIVRDEEPVRASLGREKIEIRSMPAPEGTVPVDEGSPPAGRPGAPEAGAPEAGAPEV